MMISALWSLADIQETRDRIILCPLSPRSSVILVEFSWVLGRVRGDTVLLRQ